MTPQRANFRIVASASDADRVAQASQEARKLALGHCRSLLNAVTQAGEIANEVANGGDLYPVGIRQIALRLSLQLSGDMLNIDALLGRLP